MNEFGGTNVLVVDDDEIVRNTVGQILEESGFAVTLAADALGALRLAVTNRYDVLLSDLHMPGAGDGLTVVSAMRHANPKAVTILMSAFPEMEAATQAILSQADDIILKPTDAPNLVAKIRSRIRKGSRRERVIESVAEIVQRSAKRTIDHWYERVQKDTRLIVVSMTREQRCGHLPRVMDDLVERLNRRQELGSNEVVSASALRHGVDRANQGYTAAMLVEESRLLQVSVFETLQENLASIDFSVLLLGVMTIADEVDSQLSQTMTSFHAEMVTRLGMAN